MAATDQNEQPLTAEVASLNRGSERAQAQLFARLLRRDIETMTRKLTKAEAAWQRRCESDGYVDPPQRLVIVRERIAEAKRMLTALKTRFPRS